jgi:hypothetical protein
MTAQLNLKEVEKRAFRSTYQDGLWDIYYGLIVILMSVFIYRPETGYSPMNIILSTGGIALSYILFGLAKKYITAPRIGTFKFGEIRRKKIKTMAIIIGIFIAFQVLMVLATSSVWKNQVVSAIVDSILGDRSSSLFMVASIGSLMVGSSMIVMVYFQDFSRGYYIALLMAAAVFLMIFYNQPWLPVLIGFVIITPGVVLLIRFLKQFPIIKEGEEHD